MVAQLLAAGVAVRAVANPLHGLSHDAAYVGSAFEQIPGPVLAVGHSYGAVITDAAARAGNVVGLVFVAASAPDRGEALQDIEAGSTDSVLDSALVQLRYPTGDGTEPGVEFVIDPDGFHEAFAADLTGEQARVMAVTQRPVSALASSEPTGVPAWRSLPSWAVVPTGDEAAGSDVVRRMARRAGATTTEVQGSHVIVISPPEVVADVVRQALGAVSR